MSPPDDVLAGIRCRALAARRALSPEVRLRNSAIISDRVVRTHEFIASRTLACYLPADDEVDPAAIIARAWRHNKHVYSPVVLDDCRMAFLRLTPDTPLVRNRYGLWEPAAASRISPRSIDLVVTPVVAFDDDKHRVGMGSGYFDRCFAFLNRRNHWLRPKLFGLAFECQRAEKFEPNPWDIRLYKIVTEHR